MSFDIDAVQGFLEDISYFLEKQDKATVQGMGLLAMQASKPLQVGSQPSIDWENHPALLGIKGTELFNRLIQLQQGLTRERNLTYMHVLQNTGALQDLARLCSTKSSWLKDPVLRALTTTATQLLKSLNRSTFSCRAKGLSEAKTKASSSCSSGFSSCSPDS